MVNLMWLPKLEKVFWVLFLLSLPITSFPVFPTGLGGSTLVRPLSVYPLLILLAIGVLPKLFTRPVTRTLLPFFAFILILVTSVILAFVRGVDPVVGISFEGRVARSIITLFLGGSFYLAVVIIPDSPEKLWSSLRWLYVGFGLALLWGSIQALYVIRFQPSYFQLLSKIQQSISIRKLFPTRISGLTYEPNWFAEQITFLLIPFLFSAVFSGFSVFNMRIRWRWLTVELIMLIWAIGVLIFTFSRTGMILLAVQLVLVFLFRPRNQQYSRFSGDHEKWKLTVKRILQSAMVLFILVVIIFIAGSRNNYFARLWNYWTDEERTGQYLQYIAFDQRFTYWETAYRMFEANPALGVGLGNFTFYFEEFLPDRPLHPTPELLIKIVPEEGRSQITTVKGLLPRLLAESGIIGLSFFLGFLTALIGCAIFLIMSMEKDAQFWGRAGILGLVVFFIVSFSFDSFSLPNMWVVFGFITAAAQVYATKGLNLMGDSYLGKLGEASD